MLSPSYTQNRNGFVSLNMITNEAQNLTNRISPLFRRRPTVVPEEDEEEKDDTNVLITDTEKAQV